MGEPNGDRVKDNVINSADCYCRGTRILTDRGEVEIEALEVGEPVVTASGETRPIVWIGHRKIDVSHHPEPAAVRPVRIAAGAFGKGLPYRDLWLSPGHNVAAEGVLMPISALVNGHSVAGVDQESVEYWHIELDAHDVILAEGLPAESYLDTGNRAAFSNFDGLVEAHPDFRAKHSSNTCLPLLFEGEPVARTKSRLISRLAARGLSISHEPDAHVVADGVRIDPILLTPTKLAFAMPAGAKEISLRSNMFVPAQTRPDTSDARELGLCVGHLEIDGDVIDLEGDVVGGPGWHNAERVDGSFRQRWTNGAAPLPAGVRIALVDIVDVGHYWRRAERPRLRLVESAGRQDPPDRAAAPVER